jgi:hypothetical protein
MHILVLLKHLSQIVHIVLEVLALVSVLTMKVSIALLILDLFFNILLVKSDNTLLQLFEISDVVKALKYIILELLFEAFLLIELFSQVSDFIGQTFLSHTQIINDKSEILIHSVEVLQLLSHLICLLI